MTTSQATLIANENEAAVVNEAFAPRRLAPPTTRRGPLAEAFAYAELVARGATQTEVAARAGKPRSTVVNQLRLLALPREALAAIEEGRLGVGQAKALLMVTNPAEQLAMMQRILAEQLSARAAEALCRGSREVSPLDRLDALIQELASHPERAPGLATELAELAKDLRGCSYSRRLGPSSLPTSSAAVVVGRRIGYSNR